MRLFSDVLIAHCIEAMERYKTWVTDLTKFK